MKKFLKMFGLVLVAFVMGGSLGIAFDAGMWNVFAGVPMVLGWITYLWYIMLGLVLGYSMFSFLVLYFIEKISMKRGLSGEVYKVMYYLLNIGVPFLFGVVSFIGFSPFV